MRDSSLSPSSRLGGAVISDRIVSALLEELRTGRYAQTDSLPAEVDLAAELGVSRTVIRDALSEMERAGYIERVRGIGTVVNRSVLNLRSRLDQKLEYYLPRALFGNRDYTRIDLSGDVFDVLERECRQQVASNVAHLKASCGDEPIRAAMRLAPGEAMLLLDEICYNRLCHPVMRSLSYYTNFFDFSILRKLL